MGYPDTSRSVESGLSELSGPLAAFYYDLTYWREQLARSIARNNIGMRSSEIALATNRILFPFILLSVAQDRGWISGDLLDTVLNADKSGHRLMEIVAGAGDFWAEPEEESRASAPHTPALHEVPVIDEPVIKTIAARLARQERPYDFSTIRLEETADVINQYLTRTIRRSAAHQAVVVDRPDTSPGYTPHSPALLDYAVEQTIAAARIGRHVDEPLPLRILDPACGAGSLLIRAYHSMVPEKDAKHTFLEKSDLLRYTLHGVDIDPHAVAAARMLLACAAFEGETTRQLHDNFFMLYGGLVRILAGTIRCGNALVGPEISDDESWAFCPARERHQIRCFDWQQNFGEVLTPGGFDAVICDPPENPVPDREWLQQYFQRHFRVYDREGPLSAFFVEKGRALLRSRGVLGVVTGDRFLHAKSGAPLRAFLLLFQIEEIVTGGKTGEGSCFIRLTDAPPSHPFIVRQGNFSLPVPRESGGYPLDQQELSSGGWTFRDTRKERLLEKITRAGTPLEEYVLGEIRHGAAVIVEPDLIVDANLAGQMVRKDPRCKTLLHPYVSGKTARRYSDFMPELYCIVIPQGWTNHHPAAAGHEWRWLKKRHPGIARHLNEHAMHLKDRTLQGDFWWEVYGDSDSWQEKKDRIIFPAGVFPPQFTLLPGRLLCDDETIIIPSGSLYLLGLLNSRLAAFVIGSFVEEAGRQGEITFEEIVGRFPVALPDPDDPDDAARHDRLIALVTEMRNLHRQLDHARSDRERLAISREIESTDKQIDSLVFGIYDLSVEEIVIAEANLQKPST